MKVIAHSIYAVKVKQKNIEAWVDIYVEDGDIICDWNQNDFCLTDSDDVDLKKWQDNLDNFDNATSLARQHLESTGIIYQDINAVWHYTT